MLLPQRRTIASGGLRVAGQACQVHLTSVRPDTLGLSVVPLQLGAANRIVFDGSLVKTTRGILLATLRGDLAGAKVAGQKPARTQP